MYDDPQERWENFKETYISQITNKWIWLLGPIGLSLILIMIIVSGEGMPSHLGLFDWIHIIFMSIIIGPAFITGLSLLFLPFMIPALQEMWLGIFGIIAAIIGILLIFAFPIAAIIILLIIIAGNTSQ